MFTVVKCRLCTICILIAVNIGFIVYLATNVDQSLDDDDDCDRWMDQSLVNGDHQESPINVEVWSKSAIGQYFWETILGGHIESKMMNDLYMEGWKTIGPVRFHFRTGPSLKPESYPSFRPANLVLILNWRSVDKINYANKWLRTLFEDLSGVPSNVGIIALGNEFCNNTWFTDLYVDNGRYRNLRFLFLVYDSPLIDNQLIYQWPLGVATYRHFPSPYTTDDDHKIDLQSSRPYVCNFIATIYQNSSRQELQNLFINKVHNWNHGCLIKTRSKWMANENVESMDSYVQALHSSDLTLCPSGLNVECYRILEAVEYGSIPVIEEIVNTNDHNQCDRIQILRLFKQFDAPFIYVRNWTEQLPDLLTQYNALNLRERVKKRIQLIKWYHHFRIRLRNHFVNVLHKRFVH
ncbi:ribitol-5-phosphate xylosyltransferase 1 [Dermatophagoides farinae]|uniref:ribitol-5-phosphate xylosyltransferase 1 n=1 Tax=Dermatophagoides farinae TaxID=6954 RepID=UPI003F645A61